MVVKYKFGIKQKSRKKNKTLALFLLAITVVILGCIEELICKMEFSEFLVNKINNHRLSYDVFFTIFAITIHQY